jgi:hypothetical protein
MCKSLRRRDTPVMLSRSVKAGRDLAGELAVQLVCQILLKAVTTSSSKSKYATLSVA